MSTDQPLPPAPSSPAARPIVLPSVAGRSRRRLAAGLAVLVAAPVLVLSACGDNHQTTDDSKPDPRASTAGLERQVPTLATDEPSPGPIPSRNPGHYTQP